MVNKKRRNQNLQNSQQQDHDEKDLEETNNSAVSTSSRTDEFPSLAAPVGPPPGFAQERPQWGHGTGRGRGRRPVGDSPEAPGQPARSLGLPAAATPSIPPNAITVEDLEGAVANLDVRPTTGTTKAKPAKVVVDLPPLTQQKQRSWKLPDRPDGGGVKGRRIQLVANHFNMKFEKDITLHMYDIEISNKKNNTIGKPRTKGVTHELKGPVCQRIIKAYMRKFFPEVGAHQYVDDGRRVIYSLIPLKDVEGRPQQIDEIALPSESGAVEEFLVLLQAAKEPRRHFHDLNEYVVQKKSTFEIPHDVIRVMDVLFRCAFAQIMLPVGRGMFFRDPEMMDSMTSLWCYCPGLFLSVRPQWSVRLNVDKTQVAFFESKKLVDLMYEAGMNKRYIAESDWHNEMDTKKIQLLRRDFMLCRVRADHYKKPDGTFYCRKFTVHGFYGSARRTTIEIQETKKKCTIEQYFRDNYNITLKYPFAPLVIINPTKKTYMPAEILTMEPYQKPPGKNKEIVQQIIKKAAVPAYQRKEQIEALLQKLNLSNNDYLKSHFIQVDPKMLRLTGRVLDLPRIAYQNNNTVSIAPRAPGKWNSPPNGKFLLSGSQTGNTNAWAFINLDPRCDDGKFFQMLMSEATKMGLFLNSDPLYRTASQLGKKIDRDCLDSLFRSFVEKKITFALFVVNDMTHSDAYQDIKVCGDLLYGVVTQCVLSKNVGLRPPKVPSIQTVGNILLKINCKLGGVNWKIDSLRSCISDKKLRLVNEPCMIIGADVTHPSPTSTKGIQKSIAAVVASMDREFARYAVETSEQKSKEGDQNNAVIEVIVDMKEIVKKLLVKFYKFNNTVKPTSIIYYRDGVSEGQFREVLEKELCAVQEACRELENGYEPKITFIVVQKRHHTRLFAANSNEGIGKSGNIPAGTVVDTEIVHRREFNFYLCSHEGIQGTSKPTLYHVLFDDNNWGSDDLQIFTYYLCHMYMRCTRAVSLPAPAYYAHLVAFRGRTWRGEDSSSVGDTASIASSGTGISERNRLPLQVHGNISHDTNPLMYFL